LLRYNRFALNPGQQCEDCRYFDENESARQSRKQDRSTAESHRRSYLSGQSLARPLALVLVPNGDLITSNGGDDDSAEEIFFINGKIDPTTANSQPI
jgi:hypothetical protein